MTREMYYALMCALLGLTAKRRKAQIATRCRFNGYTGICSKCGRQANLIKHEETQPCPGKQ